VSWVKADVEVDLAENFLLGHPGELAKDAEAGVVDENVDGSVLQMIEQKFWCQWRGQVEGDGFHGYAVELQFGRDLGEFVGAAGDEYEIVMVAGEEFG
jgi:hypothetical protein